MRRLIQAYLGDALGAADADRLRRHCERCSACAAAMREAERAARVVASLPRRSLAAEDAAALLARIRARGQERLGERLLGTPAPVTLLRKPLAVRAAERWDALKHGAVVAGFRVLSRPAALPAFASVPVAALLLIALYHGAPSPEKIAEVSTAQRSLAIRNAPDTVPPRSGAGAPRPGHMGPLPGVSESGQPTAEVMQPGMPGAPGLPPGIPGVSAPADRSRLDAATAPAEVPEAPAPKQRALARAVPPPERPARPSPKGVPPERVTGGGHSTVAGGTAGAPFRRVALPEPERHAPAPSAAATDTPRFTDGEAAPATRAVPLPPPPAPAAPAPPRDETGAPPAPEVAMRPAPAASTLKGAPPGGARDLPLDIAVPREAPPAPVPAAPETLAASTPGGIAGFGGGAGAPGGAGAVAGPPADARRQPTAAPKAPQTVTAATGAAGTGVPRVEGPAEEKGVARRKEEGAERDPDALIRLLAGRPDEARDAARALSRHREKRVVEALGRALRSHADAGVREAAADALAAIGTRQARALLRAVAEGDGPGKDAARKALDRKR